MTGTRDEAEMENGDWTAQQTFSLSTLEHMWRTSRDAIGLDAAVCNLKDRLRRAPQRQSKELVLSAAVSECTP